jgi:nucleoside-diphosphate-sugar epimerase
MAEMDNSKTIACVTGASGMVGCRVVQRLVQEGYKVRALNRQKWFSMKDVEVFWGGLEDEDILKQFVSGADCMYHCAAELQDESKMWTVNVKGTQRVITATENSTIHSFLYLSSAGVVGITNIKDVNENTPCNPVSIYEKTKWESEKLVARGVDGCSVVILRPTNIIDNNQLGVLDATITNNVISRLTQYIRGGECAHVVHAKDVAKAAVYLSSFKFDTPECFFISRDIEPLNSYSGLRKVYKAVLKKEPLINQGREKNPPLFIPHGLRKLRLRKSNWGDVKYSSRKIEETGFRFSCDTKKAVSDVFSFKLGFRTNASAEKESVKPKIDIETLVIIGASGFIGKNLVKTISNRKKLKVRVLLQKEENIQLFNNIANTTVFKGSLLSIETLEKLLIPGCTVVNLAYMDDETQAKNLLAIKNLSDICKRKKIKRLVHCSTATVVGNADSNIITEDTLGVAKTDYDITKLKIEKHLTNTARNNFELAMLRPTSVFGPGGKNLIKLADNLTRSSMFMNYFRACLFGKRRMNLVCLDNVISAILFICESPVEMDQEIFIISDDNNPFNNFKDLEKSLFRKLKLKEYPFPRIPIPNFFLTIILKLSRRPIAQTDRYYHWDRLMKAGYQKTTTIENELDRFTAWYKKING